MINILKNIRKISSSGRTRDKPAGADVVEISDNEIPEKAAGLDLTKPVIDKGGIVFGIEEKRGRTKIYYGADDAHVMCIGATRSGKSRCIVLQSIGLQGLAGESMVISDPKGELFQYTYPFLKRIGYDVYVIDFKNPEKSDHYNFLQEVIEAVNRNDRPKAMKYALDVTEALVGKNTTGEKIWTEGEKSIIAACVMAVVYDNREKPEYQNLTNVYAFISNMCKMTDHPPLEKYIDKIRRECPEHPALDLIAASEVAPDKTRGSFYASALATLRLFVDLNVYNITKSNSFMLGDIGEKKTALFMILPDENSTYYGVASLFIHQLYTKLVEIADARGGRLKRRVNFNLDEFGNFATIPDFAQKLTVGGGRGMRFNLFLQGTSQLIADANAQKYGKEGARTIMGNCKYWIYLKSSDDETMELFSKMMGDYTCMSNSQSTSYNDKLFGFLGTGNQSSSSQLVGRRLMKPEELGKLVRPDVLVLSEYPTIFQAPDLSKTIFNKMFGLGSPNHNRKVRKQRADRIKSKDTATVIKYWGIWESDEFLSASAAARRRAAMTARPYAAGRNQEDIIHNMQGGLNNGEGKNNFNED